MPQKALKLQCIQENGLYYEKVFPNGTKNLAKLTDEEVEHFPKDILAYKRLFAYWQDFEAKVIRPDMILHNSKSCTEVDKITKKLINLWRDEKKAGLLHKRCYKVSDMEQACKSTNPKCMQR